MLPSIPCRYAHGTFRRTVLTNATGIYTYTYDAANRLTSIEHPAPIIILPVASTTAARIMNAR